MSLFTNSSPRRALGVALLSLLTAVGVQAQTKVKPGFNIFSVAQDVEIGRQSASEAERQLPMLNDSNLDRYVNGLVSSLAVGAPGAKYPYQARVVNASDINAFALPGGYLYLNRGLIETARSEGELTSVIAHEMAHIALRHGTHQASKAYMAQAGLGILGGILSGRGGAAGNTSQIIGALGGFGMNALFLKFSRDAESQADIVGAQMMAKAGYDPLEMATFFDLLQQQKQKNPGKVEQFFSSHPAPAGRATRIRQEAKLLGAPARRTDTAEFSRIRSSLGRLSPAPTMQQIAQGTVSPTSRGRVEGGAVRVEAPSSRFRVFTHRDRFFEMEYPENWRAYEAESGLGVTIVPEGGVVQTNQGQQAILYGVIVNHYDPFENRSVQTRLTLEGATNDLIRQVMSTNSHLREVRNSRRRQTVDGSSALSVVLAGTSPVTGIEERVTVFARLLPDDHVIYSLFIAPGRDYRDLDPTFTRMIRSLRVDDTTAHERSVAR